MSAQIDELVSVLRAVQQQFRMYGNAFPDGFDGRIFRWVDDALAQSHLPVSETRDSEPTAWRVYFPDEQRQEYCDNLDDLIDDLTNCRHDEPEPLYTHPPAQRERLTDEQIVQTELSLRLYVPGTDRYDLSLRDFARAIERRVRGERDEHR